MELYTYDIEALPNFFSCCVKRKSDGTKWQFEISIWAHQGWDLYCFLMQVANSGGEMVGYNNIHYDYSMIHFFIEHQGQLTAEQLRYKSDQIIGAETPWENVVWPDQRFVKQIDLMKIHHFDNSAKRTSLKLLEFNMRRRNILELDIGFDTLITTQEQREKVLHYNWEDVDATEEFLDYSMPMIEFRKELTEKYGKDFTNHNDTKIGEDYFIMKLKESGVRAHKSIQTWRTLINPSDIIIPWIQFEHPEFQRVLNFFKTMSIPALDIKGFFSQYESELTADIDGFHVVFGGGGMHASLEGTVVRSSETHQLVDVDVASYYPNLAITQNFYPEHLSPIFCDVYRGMYEMRQVYKKGTPENAMLKLALNGTYGKSNDVHSPFYDPQYTMATTINGQLLLAMLIEQLVKIPGLQMVQANTDGVTFSVPHIYLSHVGSLIQWWENMTSLELEDVFYDLMAIRDVNNYLAVTKAGDYTDLKGYSPDKPRKSKVKRIGAYSHELAADNPGTRELCWHQNHSAVVVAKAAEAYLVHGTSIREFIMDHDNHWDFYLRTKVNRSDRLVAVDDNGETEQQHITRYYISNEGVELVKIMPPTQKGIEKWNSVPHWRHRENGKHVNAKKAPSGKYDQCPPPSDTPPNRRIGINKGFKVTVCNEILDVPTDINYQWYIQEAEKLVKLSNT